MYSIHNRDKQVKRKRAINVNDRQWLIGDLARLSFSASQPPRHGESIDRDSFPIGRIETDRSMPLIRDRIINVGRTGARRPGPIAQSAFIYCSYERLMTRVTGNPLTRNHSLPQKNRFC